MKRPFFLFLEILKLKVLKAIVTKHVNSHEMKFLILKEDLKLK